MGTNAIGVPRMQCSFPLEAMGDLPDEHKAAFLAQLEHMQVRDR